MAVVKFEDVATRVNTKEDRHNTDLVYYVGGDHIDSESMKVSKRGIIKGAPLGPMFYFGFKPGDILFVTRNPHLRKCAMVDFAGICSEKTLVIATKDETVLCQKYLAGVMQSDDFWGFLEENKSGSVNYFINWSTLAEYEFDLPPIEEQRALAEKLWAANDLKEKYRHLLAATDEMLKAKFREMFGRCGRIPLKDSAEILRGVSYKPADVLESHENGVVILRANNICEGTLNFNDTVVVRAERVSEKQRVRKGDIVICAANGSVKLVGKAGLAYTDMPNVSFGTFCLLVRPRNNSSKILSTYFMTDEYRSNIEIAAHGTNINNIKPSTLEEAMVPDVEEGKRREFEAIADAAEVSKTELKKSIASIDAVMKGLINS